MLGIITIATGEKRYIEMAKMMALSLKLTNPSIKCAVVSDVPRDNFNELYNIYIPYNESFGKGLCQKLYLDKYSPFEETLFIDADCLAFSSLDQTIELCRKHSFVVFGNQINTGEWCMDIPGACKKFNVPSIPCFNGGTYYFKKSDVAADIFNKARDLYSSYDELGINRFRGSINEEPLIALAMSINGVEAVDDKGIGMRTPIGIIGALEVDILHEKCVFNKEGEHVEPAILHFAGSFSHTFHYKREVMKIKVIQRFPFLNKKLTSLLVNTIFNFPYASLVFIKRIAKIVLRREKFDFSISLPLFSNQ